MSASVEIPSAVAVPPQSSKKRKHVGQNEDSTKKRRHKDEEVEREADHAVTTSNSTAKANKSHKRERSTIKTAANSYEQTIQPRKIESQDPATHTNTTDSILIAGEDEGQVFPDAYELSSFASIRISLYLSLPAVSLSNARSSVLALHIAPLLLTYYAPAGGIVLAYTDAVLSTRPESDTAADQPTITLTKMGEELGSSWAWLTVTLLVFKPQPGDKLSGWTNAMSEGFVGLVSYNYFQTAVARNRIPSSWSWSGASHPRQRQKKMPRKGKLNDSQSQENMADSQDTAVDQEDNDAASTDNFSGTFVDEAGAKVPETLPFKVVDVEMVPAHERGRWTLQIDGTLLDEDHEARVREEEQNLYENRQNTTRSRSRTPGTPGERVAFMSGGMGPQSRAGSNVESP